MNLSGSTSLAGKHALFALTLILISTAIYVFPPGYPQPGHLAAVLLIIPLLLRLNSLKLELPERLLIGFWVYVCAVNGTYWLIYRDLTFVISIVYWTYGLVLFLSVRQILRDNPGLGMALPWSLLTMLSVLILLGFFGGEAFYPDVRFVGTFTDPNQMSYWLLCLFVGSVLMNPKPAWFGPKVAIAIFSAVCVVLVLSSSRSAMLAAVVLLAGLVYWVLEFYYGSHSRVATHADDKSAPACRQDYNSRGLPLIRVVVGFFVAFVAAAIALLALYLLSDDVSRIVDDLIRRSLKHGILWQLEIRGYMRLLEFPQYLIFGAGQGFDGRFMAPVEGNVVYEVHSSLVAPLFYYGIIGFGLLYTSFYLIARDRLRGWQWLVFAAPFVYGLFTYGLRTPIFWVMLASLYTITPRPRQRVSTCDVR